MLHTFKKDLKMKIAKITIYLFQMMNETRGISRH